MACLAQPKLRWNKLIINPKIFSFTQFLINLKRDIGYSLALLFNKTRCKKHVSSFISCKEFPKFQNYHVSKCLHFFFLWREKMDSDTRNAYLPVSLGKTKYMFCETL
jgi:hypothetical protein